MLLSRSRNNEDHGRPSKETLNSYPEKAFIKNRFLKIFLNYLKHIESSTQGTIVMLCLQTVELTLSVWPALLSVPPSNPLRTHLHLGCYSHIWGVEVPNNNLWRLGVFSHARSPRVSAVSVFMQPLCTNNWDYSDILFYFSFYNIQSWLPVSLRTLSDQTQMVSQVSMSGTQGALVLLYMCISRFKLSWILNWT